MKILTDYRGRAVRLTDERLDHIRDHPEMIGLEPAGRVTGATEKLVELLAIGDCVRGQDRSAMAPASGEVAQYAARANWSWERWVCEWRRRGQGCVPPGRCERR